MKVFDLCHLEDRSPIETDLCIVGTGPAGLSIVNEFKGTNVRVLLLESGGLGEEPDTQALNEIQSVGALGDPQTISKSGEVISPWRLYQGLGTRGRDRILGGTSHTWNGRCAPFSPIDFEKRPWIPYSGWPLTRAELEPYLSKAGTVLGLGPDCYDDRLWEYFKVRQPIPSVDSEFLESMFWQFSKSTQDRKPLRFGQDFADSKPDNIQILLHANVLHINTSSAGDSFESVDIGSLSGKRAEVRGKAIVLCCGGIENARLLLASNRLLPQGIGNQNDLVGRFLMDHPYCRISNFNQRDADLIFSRFGSYYLKDDHGRHLFLHGLALSRYTQQKEGLLNCHAFLDQFNDQNDIENNPWPALKRLARGFRSGKGLHLQDARMVTVHAAEILSGISLRFLKNRPPLARARENTLAVMLEQAPDPESRILLSEDKKDALGIPISKVNWKISDLERLTAKRMSELLCREFARLRLPFLQSPAWLDEQREFVFHCWDVSHPTGTTRMSDAPTQGVVGINCQVHGVRGLFISGSSVFPTSGAANPTLMIVAMALRLAAWLRKNYFRSSEQIKDVVLKDLSHRYARMPETRKSPDVVKVGFVGAGQRISRMYVPVLRQMQDFQIVGFTTRSSAGARRFESTTGIPCFSNVGQLVDQTKPEFLIIAVTAGNNEETIKSAIDLKVPILTETPAAFSTSGVRAIVQKASASKVIVAVAEQTPFLPLEQFKNRLMDLGAFGEIYAVCNDFETWGYHGVAQLRRYLKGKPKYVRNAEHSFNNFYSQNSIQQGEIRWQSGSVVYNDGAVLLHNYGLNFDARTDQTAFHLHGRRGAMLGYRIKLFNEKSGQMETAVAVREQPVPGYLRGISAVLPGLGKVAWLNPFSEHPFSDEQIAVATILKSMSTAVREDSRPIYTADDNLEDMQIMQALRYSSYRNGATIRLPFNEKIQKSLCLLDINFWKIRTRRSGLA